VMVREEKRLYCGIGRDADRGADWVIFRAMQTNDAWTNQKKDPGGGVTSFPLPGSCQSAT
jgi:hypothetical protein